MKSTWTRKSIKERRFLYHHHLWHFWKEKTEIFSYNVDRQRRTVGIRMTVERVDWRQRLQSWVTGLVNVLLVLNESLQFVVDVKTNCSPELSVVRKGWLDNLANLGPLTWGRVQSSDDYFLIREESVEFWSNYPSGIGHNAWNNFYLGKKPR